MAVSLNTRFSFLQVILPKMPLMLAARDEAAEFDESDSAAEMFTDDPRYIVSLQLSSQVDNSKRKLVARKTRVLSVQSSPNLGDLSRSASLTEST